MPTVLQAGQYVARNADNTPKDPQPGDTEITDCFGMYLIILTQIG